MLLADLRGAGAGVGDGLLQHREVHQRLAAEERDHRGPAALAQGEVDGLARRLLAHELRLLAVLGVDDLVLAVLVAVLAAQVALVGDVHHQRLQRNDRERQDLRRDRPELSPRRWRGRDTARRACPTPRPGEARLAAPPAGRSDGARTVLQRVDDGRRAGVEGEHRGARHHVAETLARRLEGVELAEVHERVRVGHEPGLSI